MAVDRLDMWRAWRHTRRTPCPVCGGGDDDKRGRSVRCWGRTFTSPDGRLWSLCTREEFAGALARRDTGWLHLAEGGACRCGITHAEPDSLAARPEPAPKPFTYSHRTATPSAIYDEYRAFGTHAPLRKLRFDEAAGKKRFTWQLPDGAGDWRDTAGDRPLPDAYGAASVEQAGPLAPLAICEGENDARKLTALLAGAGWAVITPPDGAGSWHAEYNAYAAGRQVVIFADKDKPTKEHPNGEGQEHAAKVAASIAPHALTVRVVLLDEAHDIGDWIDAGGTIEQLNAIITARKPEAQNSCLAPILGNTAPAQKSCPQCAVLRDQLQRSDESLRRVRERINWHHRIMRLPKEKLSPALKPAAIAAYDLLKSPRLRDETNHEQVYRRTIAARCGTSDKTASTQLRALDEAGLIHREVRHTGFHESEIRISEGPLFTTPEAIPERELAKRHGGRREICRECGSDDLETTVIHRMTCRTCGARQPEQVIKTYDTNPPMPDDDEPDQNSCLAPTLEHPVDDATDDPADADSVLPETFLVASHPRAIDAAVTPAALLALARAYDWPHLPLDDRGCAKVPSGEPAWHAFASGAGADLHRAALQRLQSLAPTP